LRATSPGLKDAVAQVRTLQGPAFNPGNTPLAADRPYTPFAPPQREVAGDTVFGLSNPTFASSSAPDHSSRLVNDGNPATYWAPAADDAEKWVTIDMERFVEVHRLTLTFPQPGPYGFVAEIQDRQRNWQKLVEQIEGQESSQNRTVETDGREGRNVRVRLRASTNMVAGLAASKLQSINTISAAESARNTGTPVIG
jgi:beta-galactosidase